MRSILTFGRLCLRQSKPPALSTPPCRAFRTALFRARNVNTRSNVKHSPKIGYRILWATAALSPIAFVQLSQEDNDGTNLTAEGRMLEASRKELAKGLQDHDRGFSRFRHSIVLFLDLYIWEPICTGLRFLHLVFIFVPVIATVPAIWIGARNPERDHERSGTLWWYWFLVKSMERAGAAFIKVMFHIT